MVKHANIRQWEKRTGEEVSESEETAVKRGNGGNDRCIRGSKKV